MSPSLLLVLLDCRAPECFNTSIGGISLKSDIFSFGVVLWELIVGRKPFDDLSEFQVCPLVWTMHNPAAGPPVHHEAIHRPSGDV